MHLILYSKPGCHLCENLEAKLVQIQDLNITLKIRDITTRDDWFAAFQYEIPVLTYAGDEKDYILPRPSPQADVAEIREMLHRYGAEYVQ